MSAWAWRDEAVIHSYDDYSYDEDAWRQSQFEKKGGFELDKYCTSDKCPGIELTEGPDSEDGEPILIPSGHVAWHVIGWSAPATRFEEADGEDNDEGCPVCGLAGEVVPDDRSFALLFQ